MSAPKCFTLKDRPDEIENGATVYFHYPCFDGLVSCVLTWKFLAKNKGWRVVHFSPVNYDDRETWISSSVESPSAVVDFLYHPKAAFWADHHSTTFMNEEVRADFERRREDSCFFFDVHAPSCASLLWSQFERSLKEERYAEMVLWADKIDAARYASVGEAIFGEAPALRINASLTLRNELEYCRLLVRELGLKDLRRVAELPEVQERYAEVRRRREAGLERLRKGVRLESGDIVTFDIEAAGNDVISRYAPYYFFEGARYSIGVVRFEDRLHVTAMRNPWLNFESIPLGKIFERFGGGGHQRVASVILRLHQSQQIFEIVEYVKREMRNQPVVERVVAWSRNSIFTTFMATSCLAWHSWASCRCHLEWWHMSGLQARGPRR
jgi:hypothetical protein